MAFAALIAAYQEAEDGDDRLRALLPMAGRTLLEHQVRRAVAAGANHVVILVERLPAALNAAIDRLRRDRIAIEIARDPHDAADRFHAEEKVLLVADGLVAAPDCFEAMAAQLPPALLTVADIADNAHFERIDAERRWAGLALTDRQTIIDTAAMLGDWDLQSTLLRRIIQSGARFVPVDGEGGAVADAREAVLLADRSDNSRGAGRSMLARNRAGEESWPERFLFTPFVRMAAPMLLDSSVEPFLLRIGAIVLTLAAAGAFWFGWLWAGLVLLLLAGPLVATAGRMDLAQLRDRSGSWETRFGMAIGHIAAMLAFGWHFAAETGDKAHFYAAIAAVLLLVLARRETLIARKAQADFKGLGPWLASWETAIWLLPLFAVAGIWMYWPVAMALYALISAFFLQSALREAIRRDA